MKQQNHFCCLKAFHGNSNVKLNLLPIFIWIRERIDLIVDLVLNKARAYVKNELVDCSLAIDQRRIFKIGRESNMPQAEKKMDLENMLVLPGLIDAHVHLRDEGYDYKEDFYSGTAAAAAGGITTVLDMPNNSPVTMSPATLRRRMKIAERKGLVNVGFYSEFPEKIGKVEEIVEEGVVAFKLYLADQIGGLNIEDDQTLKLAFKIMGDMEIPVAVHAEDKSTLKEKEEQVDLRNRNDIQAFLEVHSEQVEVKAIERLIKVGCQTAIHLHVCHLSSQRGLKTLFDGRQSGIKMTCEVTPHHLFLSTDDLKKIGTSSLMVPPVRGENDSKALWDGLKNGWIDVLVSDHAPHTLEEKNAKSVWDVKAGIPGLETTLPLLLTEVNHGRLSITDIVKVMAENSARVFGLEGKGQLEEGNDADLVVVDLSRRYRIDASKFYSKGKYSPFDGWRCMGKPVKTFVGGQLVMDEGEVVAKAGSGEVIRGG